MTETKAPPFEAVPTTTTTTTITTTDATPPLMDLFFDLTERVTTFSWPNANHDRQESAAGFTAVFEWAEKQDFPPDHADRMRREAWGRESE